MLSPLAGVAAAARQHRLWCSCWRAVTYSSSGGDSGSLSLSAALVMATVVVVVVVVADEVNYCYRIYCV